MIHAKTISSHENHATLLSNELKAKLEKIRGNVSTLTNQLRTLEPVVRGNSIRGTNVDCIITELGALESATSALKNTLKRFR